MSPRCQASLFRLSLEQLCGPHWDRLGQPFYTQQINWTVEQAGCLQTVVWEGQMQITVCGDEIGQTDFHLMASCVMWTHVGTGSYPQWKELRLEGQVWDENVRTQPGGIINCGVSRADLNWKIRRVGVQEPPLGKRKLFRHKICLWLLSFTA